MKATIIILTAASLLGLSACSTSEPLSPDFGNATSQNMGVQIVNPDATLTPPLYDGAHAADAVSRYHTRTVEQPEEAVTSGDK